MKEADYLKDEPLNAILDSILRAYDEFFTVFKEIRSRLENKQYWLDNYVRKTLAAINHLQADEAATEGFDGCGNLRRLCTEILDGGGDTEDPLYPRVKEIIDRFHVDFQERGTLRAMAIVTVYPDYMESVAKRYLKETAENMIGVVDNMKQQELFDNISEIVGEEEMEHLNDAIKRLFIVVPAIKIYLQGITNNLIESFLHRDDETARQVFQLIMDKHMYAKG